MGTAVRPLPQEVAWQQRNSQPKRTWGQSAGVGHHLWWWVLLRQPSCSTNPRGATWEPALPPLLLCGPL